MRELGYAEVVAGDHPPDRTGQAWCYQGVRYLIVGAPRPGAVEPTHPMVHPAVCLDTGTETTIGEAWLLGSRREQ